jgi:hypothetical protein
MAFGLNSYNDSGFLQISEDYINLRVVASGSATHSGKSSCTTSDGWTRVGVRVAFSSTVAPMILIQARSDCYVYVVYVSSTEFVFTLTTTSGPFNGSINYKVLGQGTTLSSDTYGLRFWGTQGQLIFDSGQTYAKCAEVLTCPLSFSGSSGGYYVAPAAASIASLSYTGAPWIFCNPMGPIFMFWIDFTVPSGAYWAMGVAYKYSAGAIQTGAHLRRESDTSYLIAAGGERIGGTSSLSSINYTYANKFMVGEIA